MTLHDRHARIRIYIDVPVRETERETITVTQIITAEEIEHSTSPVDPVQRALLRCLDTVLAEYREVLQGGGDGN